MRIQELLRKIFYWGKGSRFGNILALTGLLVLGSVLVLTFTLSPILNTTACASSTPICPTGKVLDTSDCTCKQPTCTKTAADCTGATPDLDTASCSCKCNKTCTGGKRLNSSSCTCYTPRPCTRINVGSNNGCGLNNNAKLRCSKSLLRSGFNSMSSCPIGQSKAWDTSSSYSGTNGFHCRQTQYTVWSMGNTIAEYHLNNPGNCHILY